MIRGTTPTLKFILPFSVEQLECAWITLAQNETAIIDKAMSECTCSDKAITVTLTQEETLKLDCNCTTEIQLRVKTISGASLASRIYKVDTGRILKDGVI